MSDLAQTLGLEVIEGPWRVGSELRWRVVDQGDRAVLGQLLPELAHDPSLRRRYVRDVERLQTLGDVGLAKIRRRGPTPDPLDPEADPPWRLRDDPPGETLESWLERRAPAPVDEVALQVASLARCIHGLHAHGAVLRDLNPRLVVLGEDGQATLTDIGLARVDVLSTRTAASLLLEGSPYAAPELLAHTVVDQRADLYGLGVILYRALTGELPHGDAASLLRPPGPPPRVSLLCPEIPASMDELVARCLNDDPALRPGSAAELADTLMGLSALPDRAPRLPCQSCGAVLRPGQRLCTHCGALAVQFTPAREGAGKSIQLKKIDENADARTRLREILSAVADGPLPALNFVVGDARMYSKKERTQYIQLPATLVSNLDPASADALDSRLRAAGLATRVVDSGKGSAAIPQRVKRGLVIGGAAGFAAAVLLGLLITAQGGTMAGAAMGFGIVIATTLVLLSIVHAIRTNKRRQLAPGLVQLRPAPTAVPASDPLVARLAALLQGSPPDDLREQVGELALAVQRLVDHRARNAAEAEEIDALTAPVAELVQLIEAQVLAIGRIDGELCDLDEGVLVRALAAAEARRDPPEAREELLQGLDRLRTLEDARALRFHRLLEAARLARRAVELGLAVHDAEAEHERHVALALAALSS